MYCLNKTTYAIKFVVISSIYNSVFNNIRNILTKCVSYATLRVGSPHCRQKEKIRVKNYIRAKFHQNRNYERTIVHVLMCVKTEILGARFFSN